MDSVILLFRLSFFLSSDWPFLCSFPASHYFLHFSSSSSSSWTSPPLRTSIFSISHIFSFLIRIRINFYKASPFTQCQCYTNVTRYHNIHIIHTNLDKHKSRAGLESTTNVCMVNGFNFFSYFSPVLSIFGISFHMQGQHTQTEILEYYKRAAFCIALGYLGP